MTEYITKKASLTLARVLISPNERVRESALN